MNISIPKLVLGILITLTLGIGLGYYFAPDVVKKETKTDNKSDTNTSTTVTTDKKYDPNTGKVVEDTTTVTHDVDKSKEKSTDKTVVEEKTQKHYAIKAGAVVDVRSPGKTIPRAGAEVRLPFFNSWLGGECDINVSNPLCGGYLRMEF